MVDTDRYDIPGDMKDYVMHHVHWRYIMTSIP